MSRDNDKKVMYGVAAAFAAFGWVVYRNNERSKLRAKLAADPRSVLLGDLDKRTKTALPILSVKSADAAYSEIVDPLVKIPPQLAPALNSLKELAATIGAKPNPEGSLESALTPMEAEEAAPELTELPPPPGSEGARGPGSAGSPSVPNAPDLESSSVDVFGNPIRGELVDFEEWASRFPKEE